MKNIKLTFMLSSLFVLVIFIVSFYIFSNSVQRPDLNDSYRFGEQELYFDDRLENIKLTIINDEDVSRSTIDLNLTIVNDSEYLLCFGNDLYG